MSFCLLTEKSETRERERERESRGFTEEPATKGKRALSFDFEGVEFRGVNINGIKTMSFLTRLRLKSNASFLTQ